MKFLIIGNGGREHAILKLLTKNPLHQYFYYGKNRNPGMDRYAVYIDSLNYLNYNQMDIAIIGPEIYLQQGLVDDLSEKGIKSIGPLKELAQIETSKIFCRNLMVKYGLEDYCPKFRVFELKSNKKEYENFLDELGDNYVIKADGLHGGKGVKVSGDHLKSQQDAILYCDEIKNSDENFLIEEKLYGNEFSLMSFTDGSTSKHMVPIQDFKRAYDNNKGPNTGSMGSISYENHLLPFLDKEDVKKCEEINEKMVKILYEETGKKYCGILYGSYMKTDDGKLKVIEFNARFGDPEVINIMEILDTDLSVIFGAMIEEKLDQINVEFNKKATCCKYLVPKGYPNKSVKNHEIYIDEKIDKESIIYASVEQIIKNDQNYLYELGSRTIAIIGSGNSLDKAYDKVEKEIKNVIGPLFYRKDIGKNDQINYKISGVDVEEGNKVIKEIKQYVENTFNKNVVSEFGDFAGIYQINNKDLLVTSIDGVGTKSLLVLEKYGPIKGYQMLGYDLVHHCVNDILVKGAKPLFFLDYYASSKISSEYVKYFVKGLSEACQEVGCVLIGGETAEMPDIYIPSENVCDIVGAIVGMVEKDKIINGKKMIKKDDLIIALPSSGPHTNGYSLIRKLVDENTPQDIIDKLCATHKCYYHDIMKMIKQGIKIHGMCHITGGGWVDNPMRVIPNNLTMHFDILEMPNIFNYIQEKGNLDDEEMLTTFNCGTGMLVFVDPKSIKSDYITDWNIVGKIID